MRSIRASSLRIGQSLWRTLNRPLGAAGAGKATSHATALPGRDSSGIALFMVIGAMSILSILVTEFTYVAQINQKMAFDALDQVKATSLAKAGLKISLLRLKGYSQVKQFLASQGAGSALPVPKAMLEKIWNFPFFYPIPANIPGLSSTDKDAIAKFQKASGLEGSFTASIVSESARFNLNTILPGFQPLGPQASPSPSPSSGGGRNSRDTNTGANPRPTPSPSTSNEPLKPEEARKSLYDYLNQILTSRFEADPDFASEYRDFNLEDFVNAVGSYADRTYEAPGNIWKDQKPKRAPFYSLSELHLIPGLDDKLFNVFAPALTVHPTRGVNICTMDERVLRGLIPSLTPEEVTEFFKFRDSEEEDNQFKAEDDFWKYAIKFGVFRNDQAELDRFKAALQKRGIRLVVDENEFKITVQARLNQTTRLLEAWVSLGPRPDATAPTTTQGADNGNGAKPDPAASNSPTKPVPVVGADGKPEVPDAGLRIIFMRVL